jgi:hypothetical protein
VWYVFDSETEAAAAEGDAREGRSDRWVVARSAEEAAAKAQQQYGQVCI